MLHTRVQSGVDAVLVASAAHQDAVEIRRQKLDYEEITPCLTEVTKEWDTMLTAPGRHGVRFPRDQLHNCVKAGECTTRGRSLPTAGAGWSICCATDVRSGGRCPERIRGEGHSEQRGLDAARASSPSATVRPKIVAFCVGTQLAHL